MCNCLDVYWDADSKWIIIISVYSQSSAAVDDNSVIYSSVITFHKAVSVSYWDFCKSDVQFWQGLYVCLVKKGNLFVNDHYFCISIIWHLWHWNDTLSVVMQKWDSQSWSCLFTAFIITEFRRWSDLQLCEIIFQGCEFWMKSWENESQ